MSDISVTQEAPVVTSPSGQSQPGSDEGRSESVGQTSDNGQSAQDDNIKKLQRIYDQKLDAQQKQLAASQYSQQQLTQRLAQMEDASAPDDYTRLENQLRRTVEESNGLKAQLAAEYQAKQAVMARQTALSEIATKYGVDVKNIEKATDYLEAVELALDARQKQSQKQSKDDDDKRERNKPHLGGGGSVTNLSEWEQAYKTARDTKDSVGMMRLQRLKGQMDKPRK